MGVLSVSTIEEIAEDEWDRLIDANLKGPFLMCRAALPEFRKAGGGTIVNVGSVLGLVAMKKRAAYCASKGGVTLLTKAIAIDHGHENIRANCICPSIVETELVSQLFNTPDGDRRRSEEHTYELQSPDHLVCRLLLEKKKKNTKRNIKYKKN